MTKSDPNNLIRGGGGGCQSENCFAHFSTHSFHCIFIMISVNNYGEKNKIIFPGDSFTWEWWPSWFLGHSPRYIHAY